MGLPGVAPFLIHSIFSLGFYLASLDFPPPDVLLCVLAVLFTTPRDIKNLALPVLSYKPGGLVWKFWSLVSVSFSVLPRVPVAAVLRHLPLGILAIFFYCTLLDYPPLGASRLKRNEHHELRMNIQDLGCARNPLRDRVLPQQDCSAALRLDVARLTGENEELVAANTKLVLNKSSLITKNEAIEAENVALAAQVQVLTAAKAALEEDVEKLTKKTEDAVMTQKMIMVENAVLQCQCGGLKARLVFQDATIEEILEDNQNLEHDLDHYRGGERKLLEENDVLKAKLSSLQSTTCPVSEKQAVEDELHATAVTLKKLQEDYYVLADELELSRVAFGKEGNKSAVPARSGGDHAAKGVAHSEELEEVKDENARLHESLAAYDEKAAGVQTYVAGLEQVIEFLKKQSRSSKTPPTPLYSPPHTARRPPSRSAPSSSTPAMNSPVLPTLSSVLRLPSRNLSSTSSDPLTSPFR